MYGQWRKPNIEPTAFGQAMQQSELYDPTTAAVARTYAEEATVGVGTLAADLAAYNVEQAKKDGVKITEDEYKNNPELFSEGLAWDETMTRESALVSKEFNDAARKRAQIISDSSTSQAVLGFGVGFAAGIVEPKNLAVGVAASLTLPVLGSAGVLGNHVRRAYQMRKTATLGQRALIGGAEGVVAGIAVEPSSRYSAKILQQDYTMMDTLFNVATSAAFGAGLPVAAKGLSSAPAFINEKVAKFKGRTMDVVAAEVDIATQQFTAGQRVDVSAVEAAEIGKLVDRPVAEQVRAVETFLRGEQLPKIASASDVAKIENIAKDIITETQAATPVEVKQWQPESAPATARQLENPTSWVVRDKETGKAVAEIQSKDVADKVNTAKYDVVPTIEHLANLNGQTYAKVPTGIETKVRQAAFGDKSLSEIVAKLDEANATTIAKHNTTTVNPKNDTLIDYDAIDAMGERRAITSVENEAEAEAYYAEAENEIRQMLADDILNEADLAEYRDVLEELQSRAPVDALETLKLCLTRG